MYKCGVAAYIVYARALGNALEGLGVLYGLARRGGDDSDRCDGNALVDYRDTILLFNILARFDEIFRFAHHLLVYFIAGAVGIAVNTVEERDTHCRCADIEVFLLYHLYGL